MGSGPFDGIRVLDVGKYIAAPFCASMLADMGADVVRVEPIGGSDDRTVMPITEDSGALHLHVNRSKRSLAIDLKRPEARAILTRLIETSDVVVTNMPNSMLARLGLDYGALKNSNPSIIHTNVTAFGDVGPDSESIGFDGIGQAMSGAVYLSGWPGQPTRCAASYVDYATAMASAFATAAALYERARTGKGRNIQASLLRTALTITNPILIEEALGVRTRTAIGNRSPIAGPSDIFRTSDGWITVQVIGRDMFRRWTELVGRPELQNDPRFADDIKRGENGQELSTLMQAWCNGRSSADCLSTLRSARIPGCRVLAPKDALAEPQNLEGGFFDWVELGELNKKMPLVSPVKFAGAQSAPPKPAPALGADSASVMLELGYSRNEIDAFLRAGVIETAEPQAVASMTE